MVKVTSGDMTYYIDGYLKTNLDGCKELIKKDWDMVFVVDGEERSGKSLFARHCAKYCDPTFNLDDVVFNPDSFDKAISNANKFKAIIYDEAYGGLNSKAVLGKVSQVLVKKMTEIGRKNLFIFIVMPCFFDMNKYIAIWRSRALFHIYHDNYIRGRFACWSGDKKKYLYMAGKKFYTYGKPKANFIGRFGSDFIVDKDAYDAKKEKDTLSVKDDITAPRRLKRFVTQRNALLYYIKKELNINLTEVHHSLSKILPEEHKLSYDALTRGGLEFGWELGVR